MKSPNKAQFNPVYEQSDQNNIRNLSNENSSKTKKEEGKYTIDHKNIAFQGTKKVNINTISGELKVS